MEDFPILKPFLALLKSRKFLIAVLTLVLDAVGSQYAEFEPYRQPLYALGLALIGAIAVEDYAAKKAGGAG